MIVPTKAVILAAGFGTRMMPLSLDTPKPMMPFWGKPILGHILEMLQRWGVKEALINLHHQADALVQYLRRHRFENLRLCLSFEPEIMGTGGVLNRAGWFLDSAPFWMINADVVADLDPSPLQEAFSSHQSIATLWLHPTQGPRTVEMSDSVITNFQSSRPGTQGTFTFCGLHLLSPAILHYIPDRRFSTIIQAYHRAIADGHRILGVCVPHSYWADIGTPSSYLNAHHEVLERFRGHQPGYRLMNTESVRKTALLRRRHGRTDGFVSVGENVVIEKGAVISNSVIWNGAYITAHAFIENAIVGTHCHVHGRVPRMAVRSDLWREARHLSLKPEGRDTDIQLAMALCKLGWNPAKTTVIPFEPRGSARFFMRLAHAHHSVIMIRYSLEREENALYAPHARFLKSMGWRVPSILLDVPEKQFIVVEDLGDRSLQQMVVTARWPEVEGYYRKILNAVRRLHEQGTTMARRKKIAMIAPFSADLYQWEREFFARQFLQNRLHLSPATITGILNELEGVAQHLLKAPMVLIHRDLQSSNILWVLGQPFFIDFQGMRLGPAAYDLASLLCDPYVELPMAPQIKLLDFYNVMTSPRRAISETLFWHAAIERLAQALGAYGRLCAHPDTAWFGKYIPPGLRMMQRTLQRVGTCIRLQSVIDNAIDNLPAERDNSKMMKRIEAMPLARNLKGRLSRVRRLHSPRSLV